MSTPDDVPYADPEPLSDLVDGCRCAEAECAAHGVGLYPDHHCGTHSHAAPVVIDEATRQLVDGYPDYGS